MEVKISVIIPVYNCEKYLRECIDSVLRQTMQEIEIICVDDGSTDSSAEILDEYCQGDNRIKVFHQLNQGAGAARNFGIDKANGEYLIFLDADDFYLGEGVLGKMYCVCTQNDVKICGSRIMHLKNGEMKPDYCNGDIWEASSEKAVMQYEDFQIDYGYQGFLISRELIIDNNITFPLYRRFQDPPFFVRTMFAAGSFGFIQDYLYCYRVPDARDRFSSDKVMDLVKGIKDNILFAVGHNLMKLYDTSLMRLEYEYYSIICWYSEPSDDRLLKLLWEINDVVRKKKGEEEYILRPLKFLLEGSRDTLEHYGKALADEIRGKSEIYLYGAGEMAKRFILFLRCEKLIDKVKNIIVTEMGDNQHCIDGIAVISFDDFCKNGAQDRRIYIAIGSMRQKEIVDSLQRRGYFNIGILDGIFMDNLPSE